MVSIGGSWSRNNKQEDRTCIKLKQKGLNALTYAAQAALQREVELRNVPKQKIRLIVVMEKKRGASNSLEGAGSWS